MTVRINKLICNGCKDAVEPRCVMVCPGDLLFRDASHKSQLREPRDCWDCGACVKECPRQAIEMFLPSQIGGRGSVLKAKTEKGRLIWYLTKVDGTEEVYEIITTT